MHYLNLLGHPPVDEDAGSGACGEEGHPHKGDIRQVKVRRVVVGFRHHHPAKPVATHTAS